MVRKRTPEHEANRQLAIAKGEETYIGRECLRHHGGRRYVAKMRGICVTCYRENIDEVMVKYRARKASPRFRAEKLLHGAKERAAQNGREFTITMDDIHIPGYCPISGRPMGINLGIADGLSLDRIDNRKGYVPGNVWVISHRMNTLKGDATIDEIRALLRHMERHEAAIALVG